MRQTRQTRNLRQCPTAVLLLSSKSVVLWSKSQKLVMLSILAILKANFAVRCTCEGGDPNVIQLKATQP